MKKLRLFDSLKFVRFVVAVACMFAIMPVHAATLPAGYTELEYLESTGTQYINTGIYPTNATETMVVGQYTELSGSIFGALEKNAVHYYGLGLGTDGTWRLWYGSSSAPWVLFGTADTNKHTFLLKNRSLYIDNLDTPVAESTLSCSAQAQPMFLFGANLAGEFYSPSKARIFSVVIKNNNSLVRNFVPARRDSDGVLGMYDLADANPATAFYTNQGSGSFTTGTTQIKIATTKYNEESFAPVNTDLSAAVNAVEYVVSNTMSQAQAIDQIATNKQTRPDEGCTAKYCLLVEDEDGTPHWYPIAGANGVAHNLPAGYTELQYIESTGTQYIDTGYIPNSNTRWELDNEYTETPPTEDFYNGVYQTATGYQPARFDIALGVRGMYLNYGASNIVNSNTSSFINTRYMYVVDAKNNKWAYNDTTGSFPSYSNMITITKSLYLFARNDGSGVNRFTKQRTYSSKIYDDGILVRDFVPAKRNSDNEIGMYDLADPNPSTAFYTNAGTGEFSAGPDM